MVRSMSKSPTVPTMQFRHRLNLALDHAGMEPADLAVELLCSRSAVYGWLKGPTKPSARKIDRIAELTGVPADWLRGVPEQASTGSPWIVIGSTCREHLLTAA